jgi:heme A synthase
MRRWGFLRIAVIISVLHLLAAVGSFVLGFSIGIKRWDSGPPGILESTATAIGEVLLQPGIGFLEVGMPGELEWAIIVGNSILWGIVAAIVVCAFSRARRGQ